MYVYLAILLGISILIVWVYRRYFRGISRVIEPFAEITTTTQLFGVPIVIDTDNFSTYVKYYSLSDRPSYRNDIYKIYEVSRITSDGIALENDRDWRNFKYAWKYGFLPYPVYSTTTTNGFSKRNPNVDKYSINELRLASVIPADTYNTTTNQYSKYYYVARLQLETRGFLDKLSRFGSNAYTPVIFPIIVYSFDNKAPTQVDVQNGITRFVFDFGSWGDDDIPVRMFYRLLQLYRPALQTEMAWLRFLTGNNLKDIVAHNVQNSDLEKAGSRYMFIVGPHPAILKYLKHPPCWRKDKLAGKQPPGINQNTLATWQDVWTNTCYTRQEAWLNVGDYVTGGRGNYMDIYPVGMPIALKPTSGTTTDEVINADFGLFNSEQELKTFSTDSSYIAVRRNNGLYVPGVTGNDNILVTHYGNTTTTYTDDCWGDSMDVKYSNRNYYTRVIKATNDTNNIEVNLRTIFTKYKLDFSLDVFEQTSSGIITSLELYNKVETAISTMSDADKNSVRNIFKTAILYGKININGCNRTTCDAKLQALQNAYTAYDASDVSSMTECTACDASDYPNNYTPPNYTINFEHKTDATIDANIVSSITYDTDNKPTIGPTVTIPAASMTTPETYRLQMYRLNRINDSITNWETQATKTLIQLPNNGDFTIPAGATIGGFLVNLNENTITIANTTMSLPTGMTFYHTYTANDKVGTQPITSTTPAYVTHIFKKPYNRDFTTDASGLIQNRYVAANTFGVWEGTYKIVVENTSYYNYKCNFNYGSKLPAGTYRFTIKTPLSPNAALDITTTAAFSGFKLNFNNLGTVTLIDGNNDVANTATSINRTYCTRDGINNITVDIQKVTVVNGNTIITNPLFKMDPSTPINLPPLRSTSNRNGLIYDTFFDNSYVLRVPNNETLGFAFSAPNHNLTVPTDRIGKGATFNSTQIPSNTNIIGYRLTLNNSTGSSEFCYLTGTTSAPVCIETTRTDMNFALIYPSSSQYFGLITDIYPNGRQGAEWDGFSMPATELTIFSPESKVYAGQFRLVGEVASRITLPSNTYKLTLTVNGTDLLNQQLSISGFNSYRLEINNNRLILRKTDATDIQTLSVSGLQSALNNDNNNTLVFKVDGPYGVFETSSSFTTGLTSLALVPKSTTPTNEGYVLLGSVVDTRDANATLPAGTYNINLLKSGNTIIKSQSSNTHTLANQSIPAAFDKFEINFTKNTLQFFNGTASVGNVIQFNFSLINYYPNNDTLSVSLINTGNTTYGTPTPVDISGVTFTRTSTTNESEYNYELPTMHSLIPGITYQLTLKTLLSDEKVYGVISINPSAVTNKLTVNVNTGMVKFENTTNTYDVQALRDNVNNKKLIVTLSMPTKSTSGGNIVDSTKTLTVSDADVPPTRFGIDSSQTAVKTITASDNSQQTVVQFDFGAASGSNTANYVPVSRLEPNTAYTISVYRDVSGLLLRSQFTTTDEATTRTIQAIQYNRDANTIKFVDSTGRAVATTIQIANIEAAQDLRQKNNEQLTVEITTDLNYNTKELSGGQRTFTSATANESSKKIFKTRDNNVNLGTQSLNAEMFAGYVKFTINRTLPNTTTIRSVSLRPGTYTLTINSKQIEFTTTTSVNYILLNLFTGRLYLASGTTLTEIKNTDNTPYDTEIRMRKTPMTITATLSYGGASDTAGSITVPAYYTELLPTNTPNDTDVFVVLDRNKSGYLYNELDNIIIPSGVSYATRQDVEKAASIYINGTVKEPGANWWMPGWIKGSEEPPIYPINEYATIQMYLIPNYAQLSASDRRFINPTDKSYVISHLPSDGRAGILLKGDRDAAKNAGFTVLNFNTYTGREKYSDPNPATEVFHIKFPTQKTFAEALDECRKYGGDIARDLEVQAAGIDVPSNALWNTPGLMYKTFTERDTSGNLVAVGFPSLPVKSNIEGIQYTKSSVVAEADKYDGVICFGDKSRDDVIGQQIGYKNGEKTLSGTISDYNVQRNVWSKYDLVNLKYKTYTPKNLEAILKEPNVEVKAAMIVNDARTQQNVIFVRNRDDAEKYTGCDVDNITCTTTDLKDESLPSPYTAPTSSTGKWYNLDISTGTLSKSEGFVGHQDMPLPAPGMTRLFSDMELFNRAPSLLPEEKKPGVVETFAVAKDETGETDVSGVEGIRSAVNDILACQEGGGVVNLTRDANIYPGCNTFCCFPDDGRELDPSFIRNLRKPSGPGAAGCEDEVSCEEGASKPIIRHTPANAAYRLKKKSAAPVAPAVAPKCTSAVPLRNVIAQKKSDKLQALREKPQ
jgi:hypothetical protein